MYLIFPRSNKIYINIQSYLLFFMVFIFIIVPLETGAAANWA